MSKVLTNFCRQQSHFSQELFDADKQADTMAAKESIYIDKLVRKANFKEAAIKLKIY